jgi:hypothetical protein
MNNTARQQVPPSRSLSFHQLCCAALHFNGCLQDVCALLNISQTLPSFTPSNFLHCPHAKFDISPPHLPSSASAAASSCCLNLLLAALPRLCTCTGPAQLPEAILAATASAASGEKLTPAVEVCSYRENQHMSSSCLGRLAKAGAAAATGRNGLAVCAEC